SSKPRGAIDLFLDPGTRFFIPGNRPGRVAVCRNDMALIGRMHPLIVHFPIALVIVAAFAESAAWLTHDGRWRLVAFANVRLAAVFAIAGAFAGWRLAVAPGDSSVVVEWHRWLGICAAGVTSAAALATAAHDDQSLAAGWVYRA